VPAHAGGTSWLLWQALSASLRHKGNAPLVGAARHSATHREITKEYQAISRLLALRFAAKTSLRRWLPETSRANARDFHSSAGKVT
jgi:hypothetical protein